jgi:hypothetical protein
MYSSHCTDALSKSRFGNFTRKLSPVGFFHFWPSFGKVVELYSKVSMFTREAGNKQYFNII